MRKFRYLHEYFVQCMKQKSLSEKIILEAAPHMEGFSRSAVSQLIHEGILTNNMQSYPYALEDMFYADINAIRIIIKADREREELQKEYEHIVNM